MAESAIATAPASIEALTAIPGELVVLRAPEMVLAEAQRAARALREVLDKKPKKVVLNGEQYLEFEDWQTIARFYGVTAKVTATRAVEYGDVYGYAATAVAQRADGFELSTAESECLTDESKWRSRAVYEWKNRQRVKVGDEAVPRFQIKSMAQTRACAKVLRNVFAWVVVLGGWKPTPAEELEDRDEDAGPPIEAAPRRSEAGPVRLPAAIPAPAPGPAPAPVPAEPAAGANVVLTARILEVRDVDKAGGGALIALDNGKKVGSRNAEIIRTARELRELGAVVECVVRPASTPAVAPMVVALRRATAEVEH